MLIGLGSGKYASRKFDYILSTSNPLLLFSYLSFSFPESFVIGLIMNGSGPSQMATSFRPQQPDNNHSPCFWTESCSKLRREQVLLQKAHSSFERGAKKNRWSRCPLHRSRDQFFGQKLVALESGNLEIFIILSFFWTPCLYLGKVIDFFFRSVFPRTPQTIISSF